MWNAAAKYISRLFSEAHQAFGRLDVLVNNAGVYEFAPLSDISPEHFHKQFDLNVLGLLLASREASRYFGESGGAIVNISSVVATSPLPGAAVYSATKAAVDAITKALSKELGPRKIRVNSVSPGMVETEGLSGSGIAASDFRTATEAQTPLGRIGRPEDIAPAVAYFASSEASWTTGESLTISGVWH